MITCNECGKTNGHNEVGTSWICGDCKVSAANDESKEGHEEG
ncbi:hypothetical protein [Paenibacillus oenotherae]|nr:hypothetical protein [Paenibacillus oenotherae]